EQWLHKFDGSVQEERVQVYMDRGHGYSEEDSFFVKDAYAGENRVMLSLEVERDVKILRIDPAMDYCIVKIEKLMFNGIPVEDGRKNIAVNGKRLGNGSYVFATKDPNINIKVDRLDMGEKNRLEMEMEIIRLTEGIAVDMAGAVKKWF
ncbi:MAG: hypothetical protein K2P19_00260, partial [Kineothrix sp.]|nr:hypothetical protein [Kineothrix sp.]